MRIQDGHAHAEVLYKPINWKDFYYLLKSIIVCRIKGYKTLTEHLPYNIMHPDAYQKKGIGLSLFFIRYGEFLKKLFGVTLCWENAPELETEHWGLKHGQMVWEYVPKDIDLCLDTGHLMIGAKNVDEARSWINAILDTYGDRIKHVHLHENKLAADDHINPSEKGFKDTVITKELFEKLTNGRSYIFEISA